MTLKEIRTSPWGYCVCVLYHLWGFRKPPGSFHLPGSQGTSQLPLSNHLKGILSHDSQTQSHDLLTAPVLYGRL